MATSPERLTSTINGTLPKCRPYIFNLQRAVQSAVAAAMAAAATHVDELVKEYLLQRGLTASFRAFELELKNDKEKGLRVDKLLEQLQQYISSYDLLNLRDYWARLSTRLFARLDQRYMAGVRKMEVGLLKFYLVYAAQNNKHDRVMEFFEKMTPDLQSQPEFREWFIFPFVRNPEDHPVFSMHFTRQWQETYFLSLHNFLSTVLQVIPRPALLCFEEDTIQKKKILQENEMLKMKLHAQIQAEVAKHSMGERRHTMPVDTGYTSNELVFDFSGLSDDSLSEKSQKQSKRFALNFTSSPLLGKKSTSSRKSEAKDVPQNPKSRNSHSASSTNQTLSSSSSVLRIGSAGNVSGSPSHLEENLLGISSRSRRQVEEYEKQRRALLGQGDLSRSRDKCSSEVEVSGALRCHGSPQLSGYARSSSQIDLDINCPSPEIRSSAGSSPSASASGGGSGTPGIGDRRCMFQMLDEDGDSTGSAEKSEGRDHIDAAKQRLKADDIQDNTNDNPFILLSQEEYTEHRSGICYCRFSNSGQYVASLDADGVVKVWTWSPQPSTKATCMAKSPFLSLEWSQKSDRLLLLGNRSGNIRLFDVKDKKSVVDACADQSYPRIRCLCCSPTTHQFVCSATASKAKVVGSGGNGGLQGTGRIGRLSVWNLKTMKMEKTLPIDVGPLAVNCCAFNHNGQLLIVGAVDGAIRLFDMQQQRSIAKWSAHEGEVLSLQFSSDETSCYSMGLDNKFYQWSIHKSGKKLAEFAVFHTASSSPIIINGPMGTREVLHGKSFAFDSEGQYMLTCDKNEGVIYQMHREGMSESCAEKVLTLQGHKGLVTTVDWSPSIDTRVCLTGSLDGKVKICTLLPN